MKIIKPMLLAVAAWGGLFTMADPTFAQTWTQTSAPANYWSCVASSADGTKLVAAIEMVITVLTTSTPRPIREPLGC
jgi:hypothetical protein